MEKDRDGKSLRKKKAVRPKNVKQTQISAPLLSDAAASGGAAASLLPSRPKADGRSGPSKFDVRPREKALPSGKTSDLVKRRYSTRFTQLPVDFNAGAPPIPSLPTIPSHFKNDLSQDSRPPGSSEGKKIKVDIRALEDSSLRPEQYVASLLADASEQDILKFQQDLRKMKNRTSTDLQHNVYQNRTQFIKISKEAEKLKGEMSNLRALMSELTGTLNQTATASEDEMNARKLSRRSSVANLEALWNTHLQTLWRRVEGSQKFLPAISGRHIVYESGRWVELNAATWKAKRRVHLILLNDNLLIAAEKKRADGTPQNAKDTKSKQNQVPVQLVAQRCFPLYEVQMADLSATRGKPREKEGGRSGAANAINVRVGTESYTFATGGSDGKEKDTLLSAFRRSAEDLRKKQEDETEERGKQQDSVNYYATRDLGILKKIDLLEVLSDNTANQRSSIFVDIDGKQQNIRWVESQLDELDIDIALQHFEEAVAKIERLRRLAKNIRGNAMAQELISFKVNERAARLAGILTKQLVETHQWISVTRKHVDWLVRLGFEDRAREAYLEARTGVIKKRARQCIFDGDLHQYIYQVSFIYFTIVKNTVHTYQNCFPSPMMSACVKWAKEHVDDFNVILARQLSSLNPENPAWKECMERAHTHAHMLSDVGLDFKDLIGKDVSENPLVNGSRGAVGLGVS